MGFLFKWILRGLLVWLTLAIAHSCGSQQVFSDDVPTDTAPTLRPSKSGRE